MSNINNISQLSVQQASVSIKQTKLNNEEKKNTLTSTSTSYAETTSAASYSQAEEVAPVHTYTVDTDKITAMKEELDQRMLDLFSDTVKNTGLKQLGGLRGILEKLKNGEEVTFEIDYTAEDVQQAQEDIAPGGYWSPEETSDRLIDFAKALSGGDPAKIDLLKDAFKKGFAEIEEMFGGTLPDISYETFDLTIEKFDQWASDDNETTE